MNNKSNILKFITSNIEKQVILNKNNKFLNRSLNNNNNNNNNNYYNKNIENAKIINKTLPTSTIIVPLNNNNNNNNNNNIIRNYSNRGKTHPFNNDNRDNNGRLNFLPTKNNEDSVLERMAFTLVSFASVGLLIYVFYDGAEEMIINNLVFKKTVDTLRSNEKVQEVFGNEFTAKGLGFRSNGSFTYKHTFDKKGDKIVLISFMIESEKGKIGVVECKALRNSTFGLEIKVLKVKYENYKTITIVDEVLPKKFNNKLKNFFSIFGITFNNNNNSGDNNSGGSGNNSSGSGPSK
ncbi:hypothetical protein ACTFIV_009850 [Dictyostelium citrinum]